LLFQIIAPFLNKKNNFMRICNHPYCQHHNRHTFVCFHEKYHIPQYWNMLVLVNTPFGMHLAHIVFVNSLDMINVRFETHLVFHVHIGTLAMIYIYFEMCLTLAMVYIPIKMHLAQNNILDVFSIKKTKIHCAF